MSGWDMSRARELARRGDGPAPPLGIDWHALPRMQAPFDHAWWPGEQR